MVSVLVDRTVPSYAKTNSMIPYQRVNVRTSLACEKKTNNSKILSLYPIPILFPPDLRVYFSKHFAAVKNGNNNQQCRWKHQFKVLIKGNPTGQSSKEHTERSVITTYKTKYDGGKRVSVTTCN